VYIDGEHKAHVMQINNKKDNLKDQISLIILNWVHISLDFGEVIPRMVPSKDNCGRQKKSIHYKNELLALPTPPWSHCDNVIIQY
jgi:hypothetical protein